jgi:hypothetical protein
VRVPRRSLALLSVVLALATIAAPAHATFPGRNGEIFWTEQQPGSSPAAAELHAFTPSTGRDRVVWACRTNPIGVEPCNWVTSPATSPDGHVALVSTSDLDVSRPGWRLAPTLRLFARDGARRDVQLSSSVTYRNDGNGRRLRFLNDGVTLAAETYAGQFTTPYLHRLLDVDGMIGAQIGPTNAVSFDWSIDGRVVCVSTTGTYFCSPPTAPSDGSPSAVAPSRRGHHTAGGSSSCASTTSTSWTAAVGGRSG